MKRSVIAVSVIMATIAMLAAPSVALGRSWTLSKAGMGLSPGETYPVGKVYTVGNTLHGIDPGPLVGPGVHVEWGGQVIGRVTHDYDYENQRRLTRYVCFDANHFEFSARPKRVTSNCFVATGLVDGVRKVKLVRKATGPWRAYLRGGKKYWLVGLAPRSCPGIYAVGAWSLLCGVLP